MLCSNVTWSCHRLDGSGQNLDEVVAEISLADPFVGTTVVMGHLESCQLHVHPGALTIHEVCIVFFFCSRKLHSFFQKTYQCVFYTVFMRQYTAHSDAPVFIFSVERGLGVKYVIESNLVVVRPEGCSNWEAGMGVIHLQSSRHGKYQSNLFQYRNQ